MSLASAKEEARFGIYDLDDADDVFRTHAADYRRLYGRQRIVQTLSLLKMVQLDRATILDVGPGSGLWAAYISRMAPAAQIHLLDIRENLLRAAAATMEKYGVGPPAQAWLGEIQSVRLPPNTFDLVFCKDVIEHVPDDNSLSST